MAAKARQRVTTTVKARVPKSGGKQYRVCNICGGKGIVAKR